jgi:hypothetical protein
MRDERCRSGYRMEPEQALTESTVQGFSLLATLWLPEGHADDEVEFIENRFHAANKTEEERLRWLVVLRLAAAENRRVRCGVNQRLVVSPETLDGFCVCEDNRWCEDGATWHSPLNIASVAIVAAIILLIIYAALGIWTETKKLNEFLRLERRASQEE